MTSLGWFRKNPAMNEFNEKTIVKQQLATTSHLEDTPEKSGGGGSLAHVAPTFLTTLPEELQEIHQWITWQTGPTRENGKFDKLPRGRDGTGAGWQKRDQWMTHTEALRGAHARGHSGVGLVLPAQTECGKYVVALDFDDVDLTDRGSARVKEIGLLHNDLGKPYIEISPSGRGLRMFVLSAAPLKQISSANPLGGKDELFCSSPRWVTITGRDAAGCGMPDATDVLIALATTWTNRLPGGIQQIPPRSGDGGALRHLTRGWRGWPDKKLRDGDGREATMLSYAGHLQALGLPQGEVERLCLKANEDHYEDKLEESVVLDRARRFEKRRFDPTPGDRLLASHGDIRNARAFANTRRGRLLHVTTRGRWLRWDQGRWLLCEKEEQVAEAKMVSAEMLAESTRVFSQDQERGKRLMQDAIAAHNLPKISAMLQLAVSESGMATTDRELDADPYLLGVRNGVINLRDGRFSANRPDLLITRYCNAAHVEDWACPRWLAFLDQIFLGDAETVDTLQVLLGYTLLGLSTEEKLIICYGHGSNGKSVFSNVVQKIMGGYAVTAPPSLLTARKAGDAAPRNDLAALAGARLVSINELQAGDRLDEQIVKMLAGREPIAARFLHQEFFEYTPAFTPWLRTNHKPIVTGADDGIWRRLVLLPFGRKFGDDEQDPQLEEKLLEERDDILMWMVEGAIQYLKNGLQLSPRMRTELNIYRAHSDVLGEFLMECTTAVAGGRVDQGGLYRRFREWCMDNGLHGTAKKTFTQRLAERGIVEAKSGGKRYYVGLEMAAIP